MKPHDCPQEEIDLNAEIEDWGEDVPEKVPETVSEPQAPQLIEVPVMAPMTLPLWAERMADLSSKLLAGRARIGVHVTTVDLGVHVYGIELEGLDKEVVARIMPRFEGYTWVDGGVDIRSAWGNYLRIATTPIDPRHLQTIEGEMFGRRATFQLVDDLPPKTSALMGFQILCNVETRTYQRGRASHLATLGSLAKQRVKAFLRGTHPRGPRHIRKLPKEVVQQIAALVPVKMSEWAE